MCRMAGRARTRPNLQDQIPAFRETAKLGAALLVLPAAKALDLIYEHGLTIGDFRSVSGRECLPSKIANRRPCSTFISSLICLAQMDRLGYGCNTDPLFC